MQAMGRDQQRRPCGLPGQCYVARAKHVGKPRKSALYLLVFKYRQAIHILTPEASGGLDPIQILSCNFFSTFLGQL